MMIRAMLAACAVTLLVAGCGGADPAGLDGGNVDGGVTNGDGGADLPGFRPDRTGRILLTEASFAGFEIGLSAGLYDRVDPLALALVARDGDCAVYHRPDPGFCEPACDSGVCTPDNTCQPFPAAESAGAITLTGLTAPLAFQPGDYGYELDSELEVGDDLFAAGATISASAPGDQVGGFALTVTGVAPFSTATTLISIVDGVDTEVTWQAEDSGWIQLALRLGWHGSPATDVLLCETADDGALTIPAGLIAEMPYFEGGFFQVPSSFGRFDRAVTGTSADSVELYVANLQYIDFMHPFPE